MKQTEQTLLEQMRITEFDIASRKELLFLTEADVQLLRSHKTTIEAKIDPLVAKFYQMQTSIAEIALVIGDADTLGRLRNAQRKYVLDLFSGVYDLEYANNRLRIGLVHKRIGVEPKLYLSAISTLKSLLFELIFKTVAQEPTRLAMVAALDKLFFFDITLVFETYIRSLVAEIEASKEKSETYARVLEEKVKERTQQLEETTRTDALTGLLNVRYLHEHLTRSLRAAQRRSEPLSMVYIDINDFKAVNDTHGHQRGDEALQAVGSAIKQIARTEDSCFRYGGDEFCVILPNCLADAASAIYIDRLTAELAKRFENLSLSIGIVQTGPAEFSEPEALIREADKKNVCRQACAQACGRRAAGCRVAVIQW